MSSKDSSCPTTHVLQLLFQCSRPTTPVPQLLFPSSCLTTPGHDLMFHRSWCMGMTIMSFKLIAFLNLWPWSDFLPHIYTQSGSSFGNNSSQIGEENYIVNLNPLPWQSIAERTPWPVESDWQRNVTFLYNVRWSWHFVRSVSCNEFSFSFICGWCRHVLSVICGTYTACGSLISGNMGLDNLCLHATFINSNTDSHPCSRTSISAGDPWRPWYREMSPRLRILWGTMVSIFVGSHIQGQKSIYVYVHLPRINNKWHISSISVAVTGFILY